MRKSVFEGEGIQHVLVHSTECFYVFDYDIVLRRTIENYPDYFFVGEFHLMGTEENKVREVLEYLEDLHLNIEVRRPSFRRFFEVTNELYPEMIL